VNRPGKEWAQVKRRGAENAKNRREAGKKSKQRTDALPPFSVPHFPLRLSAFFAPLRLNVALPVHRGRSLVPNKVREPQLVRPLLCLGGARPGDGRDLFINADRRFPLLLRFEQTRRVKPGAVIPKVLRAFVHAVAEHVVK
jgi:hypothetical protein